MEQTVQLIFAQELKFVKELWKEQTEWEMLQLQLVEMWKEYLKPHIICYKQEIASIYT